ncbi:MAG: aspartate carbamoyltransferase catalytic subunit [Actinobacteria bacterium]|nr:aspartate carbamoyltransferase catalytic subunit [Actinomycetota bacterium]
MHLISIDDLSVADIKALFQLSDGFLEVAARPIKKVPTLRGRTQVNMFFEPSTRTQASFEIAGKRLSADVINIKGSSSAVAKGESLKDTILTLESYRPDIIVIRHAQVGASRMATRYTKASVINAGDGTGEHPTQCLLDLYSLRRTYGALKGLKVAIVGDVVSSRVARSNIFGFRKMGIEVRLVGPPTLMPPGIECWDVPVHYDLEALRDVDVIYLLRMQLERVQGGLVAVPSLREYSRVWGLDPYRLQPGQRVMHPGPINRGVEMTGDLADCEQSLILHQVESGLAVRMAILYQALAPQLEEEAA